MKLSTLISFALASTALAIPNPVPDPNPLANSLVKRCDCTPPKGSVCHSGCHDVSVNDILQACGALGINLHANPGLSGIVSGALGVNGGVDVDIAAAAKVDASVTAQWGAICDHLGIPTTGVSITGGINVGAALSIGAGIGGWLGGLIGGGGCNVCSH